MASMAREKEPEPEGSGRADILPPWPGYPLLGCTPAEPNSVSPGKDYSTPQVARRPESAEHSPPAPTSKIDTSAYRVRAFKIDKSAYRLEARLGADTDLDKSENLV
jgi:hypothetical protein